VISFGFYLLTQCAQLQKLVARHEASKEVEFYMWGMYETEFGMTQLTGQAVRTSWACSMVAWVLLMLRSSRRSVSAGRHPTRCQTFIEAG
jgi:hypothetical protein